MNTEMYMYTDKELAFLAAHNDPRFFIPIIDRYGFRLIQFFRASELPEKLAVSTLEKSFLYINCYNTKTEFGKWLNDIAGELLSETQNFNGDFGSTEELQNKIEVGGIKPISKYYFVAQQFFFSLTFGILFAILYIFLLKLISGNFSAILPVLFIALAGLVAKLALRAKNLPGISISSILKLTGILSAISITALSYIEL